MADDFFKTAERMRDGSRVLQSNSQYHLACYSAGYVVECYLKIFIEKTPSVTTAAHGHNVNNLNSSLQYAYSSGATVPASLRPFLMDITSDCPSIFSLWHPRKRYDDTSGWDNSATCTSFIEEQELCFDKLVAMYIANILP